jgi:hypothetical protein
VSRLIPAGDSKVTTTLAGELGKHAQSISPHDAGMQIDLNAEFLKASLRIKRSAAFGAKGTADSAVQPLKAQ